VLPCAKFTVGCRNSSWLKTCHILFYSRPRSAYPML